MGHHEDLIQKKFTKIENLFSIDEVDELEQELDGALPESISGLTHVDINRPSRIRKKVLETRIFKKCKVFAEDFFQKECHCLYDHAIYKFGLCDVATTWHQDQAYLGAGVPIKSLNFWIPMQDTSDLNGGLFFAKNSPTYLLPHKKVIVGGVEQLAIEFDSEPDFYKEIIKKGSVSIHDNFAIHASSINQSTQTRKAWIIHFSPTSPFIKRLYQFKSKVFKFKKIV